MTVTRHAQALRDTRIIDPAWVQAAVKTWHARTAEGHRVDDVIRYILAGVVGEIVADSSMPADMSATSWRQAFRATVAAAYAAPAAHLRKIGMDYCGDVADFHRRHRLPDASTTADVLLAAAAEISNLAQSGEAS